MKTDKKQLVLCLAVPLVVGAAAGLLTRNSMETFEALKQPPLSPPGWLFPVVWTALYLLMGISSYLVCVSDAAREEKARALWAYGVQLAFNFLWPIFFFNLTWYLFAFAWLVVLWILTDHGAAVWTHPQSGRQAADSLSFVGGLRGIPEPGDLSAQPVDGGAVCQSRKRACPRMESMPFFVPGSIGPRRPAFV